MVDTRKLFVFGVLCLFVVSMMGGVLGETRSAEDLGKEAGENIKNFIGGGKAFYASSGLDNIIFGDKESLSKLFFAFLLGAIIYTLVAEFFSKSHSFIKWGITIAITGISFFAFPPGYLESIRLSYGAMGLTILAVIPFLIIAIFTLRVERLWVARGTWFFYLIYYLALYISRLISIPDAGVEAVSTVPYWIAIIGGIFMFSSIAYLRSKFAQEALAGAVEKAGMKIQKRKAGQKKVDENIEAQTGIDVDKNI